ncbi:tripartite tricarboxylate transporter substrate binding protein [Bordetella holmesii]|uniref:Tripartite tricarboxylate transporter family receptor n=2 Tax=Bordetella holmesii TaxID=35814 RepID=A0A158M5K4_9BORD|nr:tripartite tricarboxylate transporter substrate binding protein [Bordetella holmesii]AHV91549.1 tripartite tricarboxylate transporter receptor family protein [Bordetella holmesii ATCC 51541]AIT25832.1 tripartite tricarboxylate transporter receptor family protein [Bordetella holmesii 44057]EWM44145.1 tripartite tricarboxylate transporter receptor family protein [Bordetella holmesii 41130]EWM46400.1 tripartite tricarboxylate transporter receptor family protein [Bordetella holmesii 35009]EWM50
MNHSLFKHAVACACLSILGSAALAAGYPSNPVSLVVGYGAGGGTDVCNRVLANDVGKQLGQTVIIENRPGAGSSLSVSYITRQRPDGYSIASLSTGGVLNQVLNPGNKYDVTKELTPVAMVAQYQVGLLVRADSPYKTLADLIAAAKRGKTAMSYSTAGIGTPQHLTTERLAQAIGTQWVHVPYKSGPESISALLRGDVDFMAQTAEWVPYVRDGRLRLLSVYTDERMPGFDAPTLKEQGYDLVAPSLLGIVGPAGMDAAHVKRLQDAFDVATRTPEFANCADQFGLKVDFRDAAAFGRYVNDTLVGWTPLLQQFAGKE